MQILNVLPLKIRHQCETLFFKDQGAADSKKRPGPMLHPDGEVQDPEPAAHSTAGWRLREGSRQQGTPQQAHSAVWGADILFFDVIFLEQVLSKVFGLES